MNTTSAKIAIKNAYMYSGGMHNPCISLDTRDMSFDFQPEHSLNRDHEIAIKKNVNVWDEIGLDEYDAEINAANDVEDLIEEAREILANK